MISFTKSSEAAMAATASTAYTLKTAAHLQEATPLIPMAPLSIGSSPMTTITTTTTTSFLGDRHGDGVIVHRLRNQLGTINGCYVPCLLNIMGIVLFERLGWGIGHVGIRNVVLIYLVAEMAAILTVLSLSAIVTNGNMRGGGSYYMISRTLGDRICYVYCWLIITKFVDRRNAEITFFVIFDCFESETLRNVQ